MATIMEEEAQPQFRVDRDVTGLVWPAYVSWKIPVAVKGCGEWWIVILKLWRVRQVSVQVKVAFVDWHA